VADGKEAKWRPLGQLQVGLHLELGVPLHWVYARNPQKLLAQWYVEEISHRAMGEASLIRRNGDFAEEFAKVFELDIFSCIKACHLECREHSTSLVQIRMEPIGQKLCAWCFALPTKLDRLEKIVPKD